MTTILQPPVLKHDEMMAAKFGQTVHPRGRVERRVVWNLLAHLAAAGFSPVSVDSGDDVEPATTAQEVMELAFNLDDCHVWFAKGDGSQRWVRLVFGNDGWDAISDWGIPRVSDGFNEAMEAFDPEKFA